MKFAAIALLVASATTCGDVAFAQVPSDQERTLRQQIEQRFDVLPLRQGLALRPKRANPSVRSIEIADGAIAVDGRPVTGAELRTVLGADADLILRVSYLDADAKQRVFGGSASAAPPAPPTLPAVPAIPIPPALPAPPVVPTPPEASDRPTLRERLRGDRRSGRDRVRVGGSIDVKEGEVLSGDAVAIGGSVHINGEVTGDAVAIGGSLVLGPHANVLGDAVVVGGSLERDPGARIGGDVVDVGGLSGLNFGGTRSRRFPFRGWTPWGADAFGGAAGLVSLITTIARVILLCALASLVLLLGHDVVAQARTRAAAEPVVSGAIGFLAQLLFVPMLVVSIVILVVTIIGIPLLILVPFAILALAVVGLVGFTAVASNLGRLVHERLHWVERNPYVTTIVGIALLLSPVLLGRLFGLAGGLLSPIAGVLTFLGFVAEYLAWTVGFGAVALLRFRPTPPAPAANPA